MRSGFRLDQELGWQKWAACRNTGTTPADKRTFADRFFAASRATNEVVRACAACPVRQQCLQWALAHDEGGYWGGMSETQRRRLKEVS